MSHRAIILVNLGTPNNPGYFSVFRYLQEFLSDPRVIDYPWIVRFLLVNFIICPLRSFSSSKIYKELFHQYSGQSPLKLYTEKLTHCLNEDDSPDKFYFAMRYQNPSLENVIDQALSENPDELVIFPLFPQYSSATTGSVYEKAAKILAKYWVIPKVTYVGQFYSEPSFIRAWTNNVSKFSLNEYDHVLFSFHGLPNSQVNKVYLDNKCADKDCDNGVNEINKYCYKATSYETARLIAKSVNIHEKDYTVCFQSRLTKNWLEPFTDKVLESLASQNKKRILIVSPAFTADCLETVIELGKEYQSLFQQAGGEIVHYVPSLNNSDLWVKSIKEILN